MCARRFKGTVTSFCLKSGYGSIKLEEQQVEVPFHWSCLEGHGFRTLCPGESVEIMAFPDKLEPFSVTGPNGSFLSLRSFEEGAQTLEALLPKANLAAYWFSTPDTQHLWYPQACVDPADWTREAPCQMGPYILKNLEHTFRIFRRAMGHVSSHCLLLFARENLSDQDLPLSMDLLPASLPTKTKLAYMKAQESFFASPFADKEHKDLRYYEDVPFVVMPTDEKIKRKGCFGSVQKVRAGDKIFCRKEMDVSSDSHRERRFLSMLPNAPHLLRLRASYTKNGRMYIIIDPWVDCDLQSFLNHPQVWWIGLDGIGKVKLIIGIMACLASAMTTLHSYKVKHLDLKPSNVGLKKHENGCLEPYVLDFGLSLKFSTCSQGVCEKGSKYWFSPQRAESKNEGPKGDIFALGVIFMDLLCLVNPKLKRAWKAKLKRTRPSVVVSHPCWEEQLTKQCTSYPLKKALETVIRMLEVESSARSSAKEVFAALKALHEEQEWALHCSDLILKTPSPLKTVAEGDEAQVDDEVNGFSLHDEDAGDFDRDELEDCDSFIAGLAEQYARKLEF